MPPTPNIHDCEQFATAITAAGGVVPDMLQRLLSAHELLSRPGATDDPERHIMDAALDGSLTAAKLEKLLPAAAAADMTNNYRGGLARRSEHTIVGAFHRALAAGAANQILDSMRASFDKHAEAIAAARSLFTAESTPEHVLASVEPGTIEAWQGLDAHLQVVARIGAVASQFGCRPSAQFPQIREFTNAENTFRISDAAVMCTAGNLVADSALFNAPDRGHRSSPWARTTLKLHSIDEARARYNAWAADEFDRQHMGRRGGWIDAEGKAHEHPRPENPYRTKVSAT